jgi:hypothetical protein
VKGRKRGGLEMESKEKIWLLKYVNNGVEVSGLTGVVF